MFDPQAWRTIWTSTFKGAAIEGQVKREPDDEIIGRILVNGRRIVGDVMPDTSQKVVYFEFVDGGFWMVIQ